MKKEYKSVGYLRTNCWNKISYLFEGKNVTELSLLRSYSKVTEQKEPGITDYPWIKIFLRHKGEIKLKWSFWRDRTLFLTVVQTISKAKAKYDFRDFVVESIQVGIKDKELTKLINGVIKETKVKPRFISPEVELFVTYNTTALSFSKLDSINMKPIKKINELAYTLMGFKSAVLDIEHIKPLGGENLDYVLNNTGVLKRIIEQVNTKHWFELPEVSTLEEKVYPGAIRTYERGETTKWTLVKDEEVK